VEQARFQYFPNPLHFHPEIEILYVIQGTGTLFLGDSVDNFGPGKLVMMVKMCLIYGIVMRNTGKWTVILIAK